MYSHNDVSGVFSFLNSTPEGNLRKMLMGGELTENHFRLLIKMVKTCPEPEFIDMFMNEGFGKIKMSSKENLMKERFWMICKKKLEGMGLLSLSQAA